MPNTTGGRGMPRYIKQAITVAPGSYDGATVSNTETSTDVTAETEGQKDKDGTETVNHCEESSAEQLDDISSGLQKVNVAQE